MSQSIYHVPCIRDYAHALSIFNKVVPIRGHSPERRPLGRRRDHDRYHIQLRDDGAVQLMVYQTAVVTFRQDGAIILRNGRWVTNSTHEFMSHVLPGVTEVHAWMGKTRIVLSDSAYLMEADEQVTLVRDEDGSLRFTTPQEQYGYVMNRKAANNVRARFKGFADYLKGFIKLRESEIQHPHFRNVKYMGVTASFLEVVQALGPDPIPEGPFQLAIQHNYLRMPFRRTATPQSVREREKRLEQAAVFFSLIDPQQPEETKHLNYYKAAMALLVGERVLYLDQSKLSADMVVTAPGDDMLERYDTALMMNHAEEVLEVTKLEHGKLPNRRYAGWCKEGVI